MLSAEMLQVNKIKILKEFSHKIFSIPKVKIIAQFKSKKSLLVVFNKFKFNQRADMLITSYII